ncbi:pyruvate dehydrogenase complex dihydrolipoamide acetyltransferase [Candidatus Hepatincola sp. Av]
MPIKILMPALSPTMTEGTLAKWLKKEGDTIKSGDVIAEVETDKATIEYESTEDGTLAKILVQNGTEGVKVNDVIGVLLEEGETKDDLDTFLQSLHTPSSAKPNANTPETTTNNNNSSASTTNANSQTAKPTTQTDKTQKTTNPNNSTGVNPSNNNSNNTATNTATSQQPNQTITSANTTTSFNSETANSTQTANQNSTSAQSNNSTTSSSSPNNVTANYHSKNTAKTFITPLARRLATQKNLDITAIKGSGPHGRIIKADVENPVQTTISGTTSSGTTISGIHNNMQATSVNITTPSTYEDKPNSGMRKTIAKRLLESKTTIPHYYLTLDCNMTALLNARAFLNSKGKDQYKLSVNDFIIKATALAMQDIPESNAYWQGETTRFFQDSDVSVAVATPKGLITPIIRAANKKGLLQISTEMKELAHKAKDGKLKPSEYQGGGFSVSNLGMFGIKHFAAIVNPPQAGILAVGATEQKPIVKDGNIIIADIMCATLSADHRILDGAVGARFLKAFKEYIENPISMSL